MLEDEKNLVDAARQRGLNGMLSTTEKHGVSENKKRIQ